MSMDISSILGTNSSTSTYSASSASEEESNPLEEILEEMQ